MTVNDEARVLTSFERALDQPPELRDVWLQAQALPPWLDARVRRLLAADDAAGDFLDGAPAIPSDIAAFGFPRPGDRVGNWRLERELDAGGMGVVFLASRDDASYQQTAALKLVRPLHLDASPNFRRQMVARFENERQLLARLSHPNIARMLDGGSTASGIPYLVMEFVDGAPIIAWCDRHAVDVPARLALFGKVCAGVQAAHSHLVVHRDLKPDNILVDDNGEPRLLDFGIARLLSGEDASAGGGSDDSATMLTAMTPAYASPEQVRRQPLTTASDVYSLGVLLHQLLAGARPYDLAGLTPAQAEHAVCESRHRSLRESLAASSLDADTKRARATQLAPELERIVACAMHLDPARRYPTAQALGEDIARHLAGQPVRAHPDSRGYRLRKFVGRHRLGTAAAAVALIAVIGSAAVAAWQAHAARRAAADVRQVNAFLMDVLELADPFAATQETTLAQALDGAAERIDTHFPGRPDLSADIRFGIGYGMLSRYRLDAAQRQLERAHAEARDAFGDDDLRTIKVIEALAGLRQEQGRDAEAVTLMTQAIARIESNHLQRDPVHLMLLNNLGNLHLSQEHYREADRWLRRAAEQATADATDAVDRATIGQNLAQAAHGLGDMARADRLYRDAQALYEDAHPQGSPDLASLLNNRAALAFDRGDLPGALALHRQSLAMRRRVFKGDHPLVAHAQASVAQLESDLGDPAGALPDARAAAEMADRAYTEPNSRHASIWATLASVEAANGHAAAATTALRRADTLMVRVPSRVPTAVERIAKSQREVCAMHGAPVDVCAPTRARTKAAAARAEPGRR